MQADAKNIEDWTVDEFMLILRLFARKHHLLQILDIAYQLFNNEQEQLEKNFNEICIKITK